MLPSWTFGIAAAFEDAVERTRALCLPFDAPTWLALGAAAMLASAASAFGRAGAGSSLSALFDPSAPEAMATGWSSLALSLLFWGVVTWIGCRGVPILLDLVVRGGAELANAWRRQEGLGRDLFRARLVLDGAAFLAGACPLAMWVAATHGEPPSPAGDFGHAAFGTLAVAVWAAWWGARSALEELVVPVAYGRGIPLAEALPVTWALAAHVPAELGAFLAARFAAGLAAGAAERLVHGVIPVPLLPVVLMLPVWVFLRALTPAVLHRLDPVTYAAFGPLSAR